MSAACCVAGFGSSCLVAVAEDKMLGAATSRRNLLAFAFDQVNFGTAKLRLLDSLLERFRVEGKSAGTEETQSDDGRAMRGRKTPV